MNPKLKKIITNKLYNDLANCEFIPYRDSVWLINKEEKKWIFQFHKEGVLFWSLDFFKYFFQLFALEYDIYEPVIVEWARGS